MLYAICYMLAMVVIMKVSYQLLHASCITVCYADRYASVEVWKLENYSANIFFDRTLLIRF